LKTPSGNPALWADSINTIFGDFRQFCAVHREI
jgi:hypothetical protein